MSKEEKGLTLIEVIIVTAMLSVVIGALYQLGISSLRNSDRNRSKSIAIELTKEAIETARNLRDTDSEGFFDQIQSDGSGYYELGSSPAQFTFIQGGLPTPPYDDFRVTDNGRYRRVVFLDPIGSPDPYKIIVSVNTYWRAEGHWEEVKSGTILTRWR